MFPSAGPRSLRYQLHQQLGHECHSWMHISVKLESLVKITYIELTIELFFRDLDAYASRRSVEKRAFLEVPAKKTFLSRLIQKSTMQYAYFEDYTPHIAQNLPGQNYQSSSLAQCPIFYRFDHKTCLNEYFVRFDAHPVTSSLESEAHMRSEMLRLWPRSTLSSFAIPEEEGSQILVVLSNPPLAKNRPLAN